MGSFWANIISNLPAAAGVFLERTRGAPLTIRPGAGHFGARAAARLRQYLTLQAVSYLHAHRIACFDMTYDLGSSNKAADDWIPLFSQPGFGQSLTTLIIRPPACESFVENLPSMLSFPHLRMLYYSHPGIVFKAPSLKSLTLDMSGAFFSTRLQPPMMGDFFTTIRHAPRLQALRFAVDDLVEHSDNSFADAFAPAADPIDIPTLRYIGLDGSLRLCAKVLNSIVAPPSTTIHYYVREIRLEEYTNFAPHAAALLRSMRPQLRYSGHESLALGVSPRKLDFGLSCRVNFDRVWPAEDHRPHVCISMRFHGKKSRPTPDQAIATPQYWWMMRTFLELVRVEAIQRIDLSLCCTAQSDVIFALHEHRFPSLEELSFDIVSPEYLLALIRDPSTAPALNHLRVVNTQRVSSGKRWGRVWANLHQSIEATGGRTTSLRFCSVRHVEPQDVMLIWATWRFWGKTPRGLRHTRKLVEDVHVECDEAHIMFGTEWLDLQWSDYIAWANWSRGLSGETPYPYWI